MKQSGEATNNNKFQVTDNYFSYEIISTYVFAITVPSNIAEIIDMSFALEIIN